MSTAVRMTSLSVVVFVVSGIIPLQGFFAEGIPARVVRVIDECSIEAQYDGKTETIRISSLANGTDLRRALAPNGELSSGRLIVTSEDIGQFLKFQATAANFVRCLVRRDARIELRGVREAGGGTSVADVFMFHNQENKSVISLRHIMLAEGFAVPDVTLLSALPRDPPETDNDVSVGYFQHAKACGKGVWGLAIQAGGRRDIVPELAVPLQSIFLSRQRDQNRMVLSVTILCGASSDVLQVCENVEWLESLVREGGDTQQSPPNKPHILAEQIEKDLVTRLPKATGWSRPPPTITGIVARVRLMDGSP